MQGFFLAEDKDDFQEDLDEQDSGDSTSADKGSAIVAVHTTASDKDDAKSSASGREGNNT